MFARNLAHDASGVSWPLVCLHEIEMCSMWCNFGCSFSVRFVRFFLIFNLKWFISSRVRFLVDCPSVFQNSTFHSFNSSHSYSTWKISISIINQFPRCVSRSRPHQFFSQPSQSPLSSPSTPNPPRSKELPRHSRHPIIRPPRYFEISPR